MDDEEGSVEMFDRPEYMEPEPGDEGEQERYGIEEVEVWCEYRW